MIFSEKVLEIVSKIPRGKVMTYKQVATSAGSPLAYRAVGSILSKNKNYDKVPCWREIRSDGKAGGFNNGGEREKLRILISEKAR